MISSYFTGRSQYYILTLIIQIDTRHQNATQTQSRQSSKAMTRGSRSRWGPCADRPSPAPICLSPPSSEHRALLCRSQSARHHRCLRRPGPVWDMDVICVHAGRGRHVKWPCVANVCHPFQRRWHDNMRYHCGVRDSYSPWTPMQCGRTNAMCTNEHWGAVTCTDLSASKHEQGY
jgi:hypothetical protein